MLPFHYFRDIEAPRPVPRIILDDLGVTPEEITRHGLMFDAPALYARAPLFAAVRRLLGSSLVRLGQFVQNCREPDGCEPVCRPLGSTE